MNEPIFIRREAVLLLHHRALMSHGGLPGIRDEGLLLGALGRAENKIAYSDPGTIDLFDLGATYTFGIVASHPFNDANKRTGWGCAVLFLKANGVEMDVAPGDVLQAVVKLASRQMDEAAFAAWLRTTRRPPRQEPAR